MDTEHIFGYTLRGNSGYRGVGTPITSSPNKEAKHMLILFPVWTKINSAIGTAKAVR